MGALSFLPDHQSTRRYRWKLKSDSLLLHLHKRLSGGKIRTVPSLTIKRTRFVAEVQVEANEESFRIETCKESESSTSPPGPCSPTPRLPLAREVVLYFLSNHHHEPHGPRADWDLSL